MAVAGEIEKFLKILPDLKRSPESHVWMSYDAGADVLYVNFRKPGHATDSELTDDDVVIRYAGDDIIGFTVLHASRR